LCGGEILLLIKSRTEESRLLVVGGGGVKVLAPKDIGAKKKFRGN